MMLYEAVINNATKGSRFKSTPVHKVVVMEPYGERHHKVIYNLDSPQEAEAVSKILGYHLMVSLARMKPNGEIVRFDKACLGR